MTVDEAMDWADNSHGNTSIKTLAAEVRRLAKEYRIVQNGISHLDKHCQKLVRDLEIAEKKVEMLRYNLQLTTGEMNTFRRKNESGEVEVERFNKWWYELSEKYEASKAEVVRLQEVVSVQELMLLGEARANQALRDQLEALK